MTIKSFICLISFWVSRSGRSCYEIPHQQYPTIDLKNKSNNGDYVTGGQTKNQMNGDENKGLQYLVNVFDPTSR